MSKREDIMRMLSENKKIVVKTIKVYNNLCPVCRKNLFVYRARNMDLPYNKMCEDCQKMAKEMLEGA